MQSGLHPEMRPDAPKYPHGTLMKRVIKGALFQMTIPGLIWGLIGKLCWLGAGQNPKIENHRVGSMKRTLWLVLFLSAPALLADLKIGEIPPLLLLEGKAGGRVDGSAWSSAELTGKVHVLMYVDPDKVKVNSHVEEALADEEFDPQHFATIGAINMAASWKPDFAIDLILKTKQEKYPNTVYVRDKNSAFVSQWGLVDQGYHVLGVSGDGKIIFSAPTKLTTEQIRELIGLIRNHISR